FFQAEDGIRDFHVTGVQTCALPICSRRSQLAGDGNAARLFLSALGPSRVAGSRLCRSGLARDRTAASCHSVTLPFISETKVKSEIGRASWRERVRVEVGDGGVRRRG